MYIFLIILFVMLLAWRMVRFFSKKPKQPKMTRATVKIVISQEAQATIKFVAEMKNIRPEQVVSAWVEQQASTARSNVTSGMPVPQKPHGGKRA